MQYDLDILFELSKEMGLNVSSFTEDQLVLELDSENKLCFYNFAEDDCLIGFLGVPNHFHGDASFMGTNGYYIDVPYIDIISGIANGEILVCERWLGSEVQDRGLIHAEYCGGFSYMDPNETFVIKCFKVCEKGTSSST